MSTIYWRGDAPSVAQITAWVFAGTWGTSDVVTVTINGKAVATVTGSATIVTFLDTVVTALNASTITEFTEITWSRSSSSLVATGDTAGKPFTVTLSKTSTSGTIDGTTGGTGTDSTACSGPNFGNVAGNYVGGALPADTDMLVIANSSVSILYGLDLSAITLAALIIDQSYTGTIGLPVYNSAGYYEYRNTYLKIGNSGDAGNIAVTIGRGNGNGSGRIKLDFTDGRATVNILNSGQQIESGVPAILLSGTHASNSVNATKGTVGIGFFGEASTVVSPFIGYTTNVQSDVTLTLGRNVTITTGINQSGGLVFASSNVGTVSKTDGTLTVDGAATATLLNIDGGSVVWRSSGTITNGKIGAKGKLDNTQNENASDVTNLTINPGGKLLDPFRKFTFTNPFTINRCSIKDVTLDLGSHITLQRAAGA